MLRTVLAGALAAGAMLAGGGAHAQGYGGYGGGYAPAYASAGYGYAPYRPHGFTLLGARAGVTVLGLDVDGSAKLTVGVHGWDRGYAPSPPPQPAYQPQPYPEPYPQPTYQPSYGSCGCAPPPCCGY